MRRWVIIFVIVGYYFSGYKCRYVDMTYELFPGIPRYPKASPFRLRNTYRGPSYDNPFLVTYDIEMSEHFGTHIDAPYHYFEDGWQVNEIPFDHLIGPAVVLDIREKVRKLHFGEDTTVNISDAVNWESKYGRIPKGAIVLMNSGNGVNWSNTTAYIGTEVRDDITKLRYAGFSPELAVWLVNERSIVGIGTDTLSFDRGSSYTYASVHNIIFPHNIWGVENVANLDLIPEYGARVFVMPLKIRGGSGSPARIFAKWNERKLKRKREQESKTTLSVDEA